MKASSIVRLIREFCKSGKGIASVIANGKRSSPTLFDKCYKKELLALTGDKGGGKVIKSHLEDVIYVEVEEDEIKDIDTVSDL
jgi:CTP:molybdopterin cytidylyltransferase MocA